MEWSSLIFVISLLIALAALFFAIKSYLTMQKNDNKKKGATLDSITNKEIRKVVENLLPDLIIKDNKLKSILESEIKKVLNEGLSSVKEDINSIKKDVDSIRQEKTIIQFDINNSQSKSEETWGSNNTIKEEDSNEHNVTQNTEQNTKILYATCADVSSKEFFSVSDAPAPDKTSIFELKTIDGIHATFRIYNEAEPIVLSTPDFLDGSCLIQRLGNSNSTVVTDCEGHAILNDDGKWKVEELAKIIFK